MQAEREIVQAESETRVAEGALVDNDIRRLRELTEARDVAHPEARGRPRSPGAVRAMDNAKQKITKQVVND